jgi:signal peptidase I
MGDNRNDSRDSHVWGTFPQDRVVGRATLVFWPLSHVKRVRGGE